MEKKKFFSDLTCCLVEYSAHSGFLVPAILNRAISVCPEAAH